MTTQQRTQLRYPSTGFLAFGWFFVAIGAFAIFIDVGAFGWVMLIGGGVLLFVAMWRRRTGGTIPATARRRSGLVLALYYGGAMAVILGTLLKIYSATH